ncbi:glycosyltransferase family 2 protein, partial [Citrobacter sp. TBCS-11]
MNPLISIIVPTYNVEKYIRTCIESILAQTYRNVEVIIVNDGST